MSRVVQHRIRDGVEVEKVGSGAAIMARPSRYPLSFRSCCSGSRPSISWVKRERAVGPMSDAPVVLKGGVLHRSWLEAATWRVPNNHFSNPSSTRQTTPEGSPAAQIVQM